MNLVLFDLFLIRDHVLIHIIWWSFYFSLMCRLSVQNYWAKCPSLWSQLPFLSICLTLCLLLCACWLVGGQHLPQPWLRTDEEHECTGVLFIPEFLLSNHWWSAHHIKTLCQASSFSRLSGCCQWELLHRARSMYVEIFCSSWNFIADSNL